MSDDLKNELPEAAAADASEIVEEVAEAVAEDTAAVAAVAGEVAAAEGSTDVVVVEETEDVVVADAAGEVVEAAEVHAVAAVDPTTGDVEVGETVVTVEPEREVRRGPSSYVESEGGRTSRIGSGVKVGDIDYKNIALLSRFLDRRGRILSRRKTRVSAKVQRRVAVAVKRARHLALVPYTADQTRTVRKRR